MHFISSIAIALLLILQTPIFSGGAASQRLISPPPTCTGITGTYTDCFTSVQNPIAAPWTSVSASGLSDAISTGTGAMASSNLISLAFYSGGTFSADQSSSLFVADHGGFNRGSGFTGPCVRIDSSGNGYCYPFIQGFVMKVVVGSGTAVVVSGCPVGADGDQFKLSVVGSTFTCLDVTSGLSATGTDSSFTTGKPGFLVDNETGEPTTQVTKIGMS